MNATPRFFWGLAAGVLTMLGVNLLAFFLVLGVPTGTSRWTYEVNRKKHELAAASHPPRLLIVGGSGVLFGINAREIEQETGAKTLNLGTHAALGAPYMLSQIRRVARPGDTVLLVLEYELYADTLRDEVYLDYLISRDPDYFWSLPLGERGRVFMYTSSARLYIGLKNRFKSSGAAPGKQTFEGAYNVGNIDGWGDQTDHPRSAAKQFELRPTMLGRGLPPHPDGFLAIASFCEWARQNDIRVLATWPSTPDQPSGHTEVARQTAAQIATFYRELDVPVVGQYTDSLLPQDQFFDTVYHLTEEASFSRAQRLGEQLGPLLKEAKPVRH